MKRFRRHRRRAFTLIEILTGLVISTLILGAAAGVFVTTITSWERGSRSYRLLQEAQTIGDLIERHLRSAIDPAADSTAIFWGFDQTEGEANGHQLSFISSASGRFPRSSPPTDASEVEFSFDPTTADGLTMRIDSSPDDLADMGGYRATLSGRVESFQVVYNDGEEWVEEWFETALPKAIEFRLTFVDREEQLAEGQTPRRFQISRLISMPRAAPGGVVPIGEAEVPAESEPVE